MLFAEEQDIPGILLSRWLWKDIWSNILELYWESL